MVKEFEENLNEREIVSAALTIDNTDFDITPVNRWTGCKICIADILMVREIHFEIIESLHGQFPFKGDKMQKIMLPSYNRQLVLLSTNSTTKDLDVKVEKFHHPIILLSHNDKEIVQSLACRNGIRELTNYYKAVRKLWTSNSF